MVELQVVSHLSARHRVSCALYDPTPGPCDCCAVSVPLVRLDAALKAVSDALKEQQAASRPYDCGEAGHDEGCCGNAGCLHSARAGGQEPAAGRGYKLLTESQIDEFIEDYEMCGEDEEGRDACYSPNANERALIKDAIMGLFSDFGEASTPQRKPLSFEQVEDLLPDAQTPDGHSVLVTAQQLHDFARAIEAAHEIK